MFIYNTGNINGNLTLNPGSTLMLDIVGGSNSTSGNISGNIYASNANLVYNVSANANETAVLPTGFSTIAYQVSNGATLTLSSASALTGTLGLAGTGSVVFNGSIAANGEPAIQSQALLTPTGYSTAANALTITNNGSISVAGYGGYYYYYYDQSAVVLGSGDTLVNNGTITMTSNLSNPYYSDYYYYGAAVEGGQSITNTGVISASGFEGIDLENYYYLNDPYVQYTKNPISVTNSGTISSDQTAIYVYNSLSPTIITNSGTISGDYAALDIYGKATITNSGTIFSGHGNAVYALSGQFDNQAGGLVASIGGDAIDFGSGTIDNAGTIIGNVNFGYMPHENNAVFAPSVYIADGGTLRGNLTFANTGGNELIETGSGYGVTGTINGGTGTNFIGHLRTSNATVTLGGTLPTGFSQEFVVASGAATVVTIQGPATSSANIDIGGNGAIVNQANTTGIVQDMAVDLGYTNPYIGLQLASFTNQANVGAVVLTTNTIVNSGVIGTLPDTGGALDQFINGSLSLTNSGTIQAGGAIPNLPNYRSYYPAAQVFGTLTGTGQITNSGTITNGLGVFIAPQPATPGAAVTLNITNTGTITGFTYYPNQSNQTVLRAIEAGIGDLDTVPNSSIVVNNSGTITGQIVLQANSLSVIDSGSIVGGIFLNHGIGSVDISGAFEGNIGGTGTNSVTVSGGSATAPVMFDRFINIASYAQTAGFAVIGGTADLGGADISGGTLVGLVGSTITAPLITVGSAGTFASGGTVNANLLVNGTLHVGASPDTMTVNGNVALASGSTSIFEVSPTAASKLAVTGKVSIASGTTLQVAQLKPIMPGTRVDLISATQGVDGTYSTLTGIAGKLTNNGDDLSLLVLFDTTKQPETPQVLRSINYVNNALASGSAPAALFAALPSLTSATGAPVAQAFARATPEPYASATQMGVESGLVLSGVARGISADTSMRSGRFFSFGQALGNWRGLSGDAGRGTSDANIRGYGLIGGLGVVAGPASLAAFGGYLDQTQDIDALGASTNASGFVGGAALQLTARRASLAVAVLYDGSSARTSRITPDGMHAQGDYDLHTWTVDEQLAVKFAVGEGWEAKPHVGATWMRVQRAATSESLGSVFALDVAGNRHTASFVDGGLRIQTSDQSTGRFRSFVDLGMRYQLQGKSTSAVAGFADQPVSLVADGTRRSPASAMVSAGGTYRVTPAVSLFVTDSAEMTQKGNSVSVTGGVRMRF